MTSSLNSGKLYFLFFLLGTHAISLQASEVCLEKIEQIESHFNNLKALPLGIDGQIQIDKDARGLDRFRRENQTLLIDAERLPLLSEKRKELYPFEYMEGHIHGIHIAVKTSRTIHTGVEVFNS